MATNYGQDPGLSGSIPVPLTTTGPEYAVDVGTILDAILDRWAQAIQTADIDIDNTLDMNAYRLSNVSGTLYIDHSASVSGGSFPRMTYFRDGQFYVNDTAGNEIQITDAGGLNASLLGGIGGDYTTTSADVSYVNASGSYFFNSAPNTAAQIDVGDVKIKDTTSVFGVILNAPSGMTSDYNVTFPVSASAGEQIVMMKSDGTLSVDGKGIMSGSGLQLGYEGQQGKLHIVSGSLRHGDETLSLNAIGGIGYTAAATDSHHQMPGGFYSGSWIASAVTDKFHFPVPLRVGDSLRSFRFMYEGSAGSTKTFTLNQVYYADGTVTQEVQDTATAPSYSAKIVTCNVIIQASSTYWVEFKPGTTGDRVFGIEYTYDRP